MLVDLWAKNNSTSQRAKKNWIAKKFPRVILGKNHTHPISLMHSKNYLLKEKISLYFQDNFSFY
jgi:hypothetical protein